MLLTLPRFLFRKIQDQGVFWCLKQSATYALFLPFAVALRIILLALKPAVHIRFGQLESPRIGNLASLPEFYLCERDAGMHPTNSIDLWYHYDVHAYSLLEKKSAREMVSNEQLLTMWQRKIHITRIAKYLDSLNKLLRPGHQSFVANMPQYHWDPHGFYENASTHLAFTSGEEQKGLNALQKMGIGPDEPFVCLHVRDANFLNVARPLNSELPNDRRGWDFRDSDIRNYSLAAETLANLGYYVIRMGKHVSEPFASENPRIIDYAFKFQSDFMDVFLPSRCSFFIGQNSGGSMLPMVFRKPMVFVNIFPLAEVGHCQYANGMLILKKYYSKQLGRMLSFREVFDKGLSRYSTVMPKDITKDSTLALEILDNTPEEINEAVLAMHNRLESASQRVDSTPNLQEEFESIVKSYPLDIPLKPDDLRFTVVPHYLDTNRQLLD